MSFGALLVEAERRQTAEKERFIVWYHDWGEKWILYDNTRCRK